MLECPLGKITMHATTFYFYRDFVIPIDCVKVRWRMIPIEHCDHNS